MKKLAFAAILASAFASTGALAQAYVSADIGTARVNVDCTGVTSCDKSDTAYGIVGGYTFNGGVAAELGYARFGKVSATVDGIPVQIKADGITFGGAYRLSIADDIGLNLRGGFARVKTTASASSGAVTASIDQTKTKPYLGLGIDYAVTKQVKIGLNALFTKAEFEGETASVRSISAGLRYDF